MRTLILLLAGGCAAPEIATGTTVLTGGTVVGLGVADVRFDGPLIDAIGPDLLGDRVVDMSGMFLTPAVIDAHVHLAFWDVADALPAGGLAAVVDLAAPIETLGLPTPLTVVASGPMITADGGYPTRSWGSGGYGLEVSDAAEAAAAVDTVIDAGAGVVKLPVTLAPVLGADALRAAADRAHERGVLVVSHALSDSEAETAARAGADVLAHTPTSLLSPDTLSLWSTRAVISTLRAFGDSEAARSNLGALHAAGATVIYGTDLGNNRVAAIDGDELAAMRAAGLTDQEVLRAATSVPAAVFGLSELGAIEVGKQASLLVLERDPTSDVTALAAPSQVWIAGQRR